MEQTFTQSNPELIEWNGMDIVEKYNHNERRWKNMTGTDENVDVPWGEYYCNYNGCNDNYVKSTTTNKPGPTTKHTTKKPNSSAIASISLPLLLFAILSSILVL